MIRNSDNTVTLQALVNGKYVCTESAGNMPLIADRGVIAGWEKFFMTDNPDGSVSFRANSNNRFVCADNQGNSPLIANRDEASQSATSWEKFFMSYSSGN